MKPRRIASNSSCPICTASVLALAMLVLATPALAQDREGPRVSRGELVEIITPYVFDGDLRDLPRAAKWRPGDPIKEIPRRHNGPLPVQVAPANPTAPGDALAGRQPFGLKSSTRAFGTPDLNFPGQGFTGVNPPDTVGDIGPSYYIQMINGSGGSILTIYDKSTGSVAAGPLVLDNLAPTSPACSSGVGDPIVLWDNLAQRWLLSEFAGAGNHLCVYISQTSDPISGGWFTYDFQTPSFPDYPKYAVWPDAYYVSTNESSVAQYALERSQMLIGGAASSQRFTAPDLGGFGFQATTASDLDGPAPPAGSPQYFIRHNDDEAHNPGSNDPANDFLEIFELSVDFNNAANSTFTGPFQIAVADFDSDLCGLTSFSCIDQPGGGSANLDPLREVVMWRSQYRNFGSHETLVGSLATDVTGADDAGVRWYELRKSGGGPWTLFQEGTYDGPAPFDGDSRWMSSAAMDVAGNIAVGYNISSTVTSPGLRYAGRLASDPAGTLPQGENTLVNGIASHASNRYGDYSSLNVDPVDGCTMWFTGEYNTSSQWSTRIGSFVFDGCLGTCGNGIKEGGEVCDGADLGGETCGSQGCDPGAGLACLPDCSGFDTSGCSNCPVCDNDGTCDLGEDCNGCSDCPGGSTSGADCGNGVCEAGNGEDCVSCPDDCNGTQGGKPANRFCCGDGDGQSPVACSDARCDDGGVTCTDTPVLPGSFCCGLFGCESGEDCSSCALDCTTEPGFELSCDDTEDNDCDGLADCADTDDCSTDPACDTGGCADVGESCRDDIDCCSLSCSGGKPSTRTCLP